MRAILFASFRQCLELSNLMTMVKCCKIIMWWIWCTFRSPVSVYLSCPRGDLWTKHSTLSGFIYPFIVRMHTLQIRWNCFINFQISCDNVKPKQSRLFMYSPPANCEHGAKLDPHKRESQVIAFAYFLLFHPLNVTEYFCFFVSYYKSGPLNTGIFNLQYLSFRCLSVGYYTRYYELFYV